MSFKNSILLTGGTSGLGYEASLAIAKQRPHHRVVIASRTNNGAADKINAQLGQKNVVFLRLDLEDLENVRSFAQNFKQPPISSLVLNAALQFPGEVSYNAAGIERTFAINHVGGALLFHLMAPHLTSDARIVVVASGVHDPETTKGMPLPDYTTAEGVARPDPKTTPKDGRLRYVNSKLTNILWQKALARRSKWSVTSFDPGLMPGSGLARDYAPFFRFIWFNVMPHMLPLMRLLVHPNIHSPAESGAALARLAVGDDVKGVTGKYFVGLKERDTSKFSQDETKQEDLWSWTIGEISKDSEEKARFETLA